MADESRIPVIVGGGQISDRPDDPADGLDSLGLMIAALERADRDAGGDWLRGLDSLAVVDQISFPGLGDLPKVIAESVGASPGHLYQTPVASGDSPLLLLNEAANRIRAGEIEIAAVVGGEALRTAAGRKKAEVAGRTMNENRSTPARAKVLGPNKNSEYYQRLGVRSATDVYPLYENGGRAAYGQSLEESIRETSAIWSLFSEVAVKNEGAWIRDFMSPDVIATPTAENRPIAFPYTKFMVANSSVNQGAGFIVTSLARARAAGIAEDRCIYVGQGAAAHEPHDLLDRDRYDQSSGMNVSLRRGLEVNGLGTEDLDYVEFYSCFPCVPKMARRVIGWPVTKPASVFGGLTFGGGPIGNYMSHAVVGMVSLLRQSGRHGLLFANGGFATHNHTIVLSRDAAIAAGEPKDFDYQGEADAQRGPVPPFVEDYLGSGTIETYTVPYDRMGAPRFAIVVARTPTGERFIAKVPASDEAGILFLTDGASEPIGCQGKATLDDDGERIWTRS
jgi:acetyl-CoA C-acetyltransferase